ncbi:50S ribosomal protein L10 [candidate division KSB1 bacterium]
MLREEKTQVVEELHKVFSEAKGVYLTDFTGIDVDTINKLRTQFKENDINYRIVKNTLTILSIKDLSLDDLQKYLIGPTAIAYSYNDAMLPGKVIEGFQKKTSLLPLKAAIVEGIIYDKAGAEKIITLPSRDELIAKMLGSLNSPISGLVMTLSGILRNFVGVLSAIRDKKEETGDQPAVEEEKEQTTPASEPKDEEVKAEAETSEKEKKDEGMEEKTSEGSSDVNETPEKPD